MSDSKNLKWIVWFSLALPFFLSSFHRTAPGVIVDNLMVDFNIGATAIGVLSSVYFYIYMIMQIPTGILSDTIGPRYTVWVGCLITALGSVIFAIAPSFELALIGRFLVGLGVSVFFICTLKIQSVWFRPNQFATVTGLLTAVGTLGSIAAITPLAIMADYFNWRYAFVLGCALSLIAAAIVWFFV